MKTYHQIAGTLVGAALLVAVGMTASFWAFGLIDQAAAARQHVNRAINRADELLSAVVDAETGQRGFALTGDERFLEPYLAVRGTVGPQLAELRELTDIAAARAHLDAVAPLIEAKLGQLAELIALRRNKDLSAVLAVVGGGEGKRLMDAIRIGMKEYIRIEEDERARQEAHFRTNMNRLFVLIVAASLAALVLAGAFAFLLHRQAGYRLKQGILAETQHLLALQEQSNEQLQEANLSLVVSEEKLAVTLKSIGDGVIATDVAGGVTFLNPVAEKLCGWALAEARGRPVDDVFRIVKEATRESVACPVWQTLAEGAIQCMANHTVLIARHGAECAIADSCAPIRDRTGRTVGAVLVFRDVTREQAAEEVLRHTLAELNRANAGLAQTAKLKDEFLANMSHELRTPLNAVLGLSETLLEQIAGPLTPRQIKSVTTISTSGQHLLTLINDILDLSKIEAGKLELNLATVNTGEFCQSCLALVKTQALKKQIGVSYEEDGRLPTFPADPQRFKQVLVNLLTNAVKFTPEGGRIGLTVAAAADGDEARFTVWDTGIGIAPEDVTKLFSSFSQIDSGLNRAQQGSGLGLALVAKLVELHGGSVALESAPGQGSRFIVTLPAAMAVAPPQAAVPGLAHRDYRRALVIEDDPTAGGILVDYLTELGLACVLHPHGTGAVAAVQREKPDVILLDIQLPGESGWVVLARLKEDPVTRNIPVVVISVVDEPGKSRALGAVAHFTKPVTRAQLAGLFKRGAAAGLPVPRLADAARRRGPLVLLAEDNEANAETLGGYLECKGYTLHYARNGLVAVEMARKLHPALILMDIQMPVMDGLTAIRAIRADPQGVATPIVALTALAMPGDRERCLAAGATAYMSKPVSLKALATLAEKLVGKGEPEAATGGIALTPS